MGYSPPPTSDLSHYLNLSEAVELGYGGYQTLRRYIAEWCTTDLSERVPST